MKVLFDFFPILLFFVAFKTYDIFVATGVAIVASIIQVAWLKFSGRKVETMHWITLGWAASPKTTSDTVVLVYYWQI